MRLYLRFIPHGLSRINWNSKASLTARQESADVDVDARLAIISEKFRIDGLHKIIKKKSDPDKAA